VTVHVESQQCWVVGGEYAEFHYAIDVASPIAYTRPASVGCGPCNDSLVSFEIGETPIVYNQHDSGCCPPVEAEERTLEAGPITGTIPWQGVQWRGPSDTSEPYGPPFPVGEYALRVTLEVPGQGAITAELPIRVVARVGAGAQEGIACLGDDHYVYPSGDTTLPDPTSCNTCTCDNGMVTACTEIACARPCPDGSELSTDCAHLSSTGMGCEIARTACLPTCATDADCAEGSCQAGACEILCD
jgi:hypothetical protein